MLRCDTYTAVLHEAAAGAQQLNPSSSTVVSDFESGVDCRRRQLFERKGCHFHFCHAYIGKFVFTGNSYSHSV